MDFIRRGWLFTKAKIGRTVLLIVAFSAILILVLSGLIINSAANVSIENAKKAAGATVSLSVDMQNVIKEAQSSSGSSDSSEGETGRRFNIDMPTISETTAKKIAELDGVKSYSFTYQASALADSGIEKVSTSGSNDSASEANGPGGAMGGGPMEDTQEDFTVYGTNDLATNTSFTDSYKIDSGRAINASDEGTNNVVIESTLASQNNLKVGSTFSLTDSNSKTYKMTVVGIYTTTSSSTESSIQFMNTMYTSLSVANAMKATSGKISNATYSMTDPADADSFVEKANKLIDDDSFQVSKNDEAYQNVKSSLNNVASFARNIVLIVAIAGAVILTLIIMLMVRERRFEIGVLMSLGESKIKIIGQFFFELFIVMMVSVGIASLTGNMVGNVVGQKILEQETTQTTSSKSNTDMPGEPGENGNQEKQPPSDNGGGFMGKAGGAMGIGQSKSETQALEKLNVKISYTEILLLITIAILITLIAVGLASIGILRLNPKQVLTS